MSNNNTPNTETTVEIQYIGGTYDGAMLGPSSSSKIGFYGTAPIPKRTTTALTAVTTTGATSSSPYGFTSTQANNIISMLNEVMATLVAMGQHA